MEAERKVPTRRTARAVPLLAAMLLVVCAGSCRDEGGTGAGGEAQRTHRHGGVREHDPNAENPDRDSWVDLRDRPFKPEWVGGTLTVGRSSIVPTLNNLIMRNSGDGGTVMRDYLCPRLVSVDPDMKDGQYQVVPWAAAALPTRQADGLSYVWKLRQDLTWEDGRPVTAGDYAFTWKMLQNSDVSAGIRRGEMEQIASVSATDRFTLEVVFKKPYYNAVAEFGLNFTVVPEHAVPHEAEAFNKTRRHLSFGAYRIAIYDETHLLMELRPEYRQRRYPIHPSYVQRVEYRQVQDRASILAQLKSGEVGIATLTSDQFDEEGTKPDFRKACWRTWYYLPGYTFICWNLWARGDRELRKPHRLFEDQRVRFALGHLFPRDRLVDELCRGRARPADGPFFFRDSHRHPDVMPLPHDPKKAGELLEASGWKLNDKGLREKNGVTFSFDLQYPGSSKVFDVPVNRFQSSARKIGVDVKLQPVDMRSLGAALGNRTFDAFCARWGINPPVEPDLHVQWHSSAAGSNGKNYAGLKDSEVDRLIESYRGEFDTEKRRDARRSLHRRIHELQPYAFVLSRASTVAVSRKWANVKIHDMGPRFSDLVLRELWK